MNKIVLIFKREFLNRVQKKSFLIATILIPLIFPAIIGAMVYVAMEQEKSAKPEVINVIDETGRINFENTSKYIFKKSALSLDEAKKELKKSTDYGVLVIPNLNLEKPEGIVLYAKENPSIRRTGDLEGIIEGRLHDLKLEQFNIDKETLKKLKTDVDIKSQNVNDDDPEKKSDAKALWIAGFVTGILIYMFVLIYGMQIMLGVIEEKTSKIVEVIVSSVKPFQLMMGKILGIAAVGLLQFTIWVILISTLSSATMAMFGMKMPQKQAMEQVQKEMEKDPEVANEMQNNKAIKLLNNL